MQINDSLQDLILSDYQLTSEFLYKNPDKIKHLLLELSIFRTFVIKQKLLAEFKEFEHTFTIENSINNNTSQL